MEGKTLEEIVEMWNQESISANKCIVEILNSYFECIFAMHKTLSVMVKANDQEKRKEVAVVADATLDAAQELWEPVLEAAKTYLEREEADDEK